MGLGFHVYLSVLHFPIPISTGFFFCLRVFYTMVQYNGVMGLHGSKAQSCVRIVLGYGKLLPSLINNELNNSNLKNINARH